jgi:putative (di)nucleoside polyphosphate hydrolase
MSKKKSKKPVDPAELPYRPCVGVMILNKDGLVWVGHRKQKSDNEVGRRMQLWQMPQGGIDKGEDPIQAAHREVFEETGMESVKLIAEAPNWINYDLPEDRIGITWGGKYRGQTQKWFAFRFEGDDSEIDLANPGGGHKPEFEAWRWEPLAATPALIIPFKRGVYERVVEAFLPFAHAV